MKVEIYNCDNYVTTTGAIFCTQYKKIVKTIYTTGDFNELQQIEDGVNTGIFYSLTLSFIIILIVFIILIFKKMLKGKKI